jgi:hypothetical protein
MGLFTRTGGKATAKYASWVRSWAPGGAAPLGWVSGIACVGEGARLDAAGRRGAGCGSR